LLDAVKDRKARDAVKSVIERFTGIRQKSAEPDQPVPPTGAAATEPPKPN